MTRILIAGFKHETNTFSAVPTDLKSFRARALYYGDMVSRQLSGTKTEPAAFLDYCATEGWQAVKEELWRSGGGARDGAEKERLRSCGGAVDALESWGGGADGEQSASRRQGSESQPAHLPKI